jgi:SAM-dependent methyltransferase
MDLRMSFWSHLRTLIRSNELENNNVPFVPWSNGGYCHCCRSETEFHANNPWLRDHYVCKKCNSIPRQRHLQMILDRNFPGWEEMLMHESSPSTWMIGQYAKNYSTSQYMPNVEPGSVSHGVLCQNLEQLTFENETFDIFITQDVMEHVFNPEKVVSEVMRVLKPGGSYIFTAPKHKGLLETTQRARMHDDGTVEHLMPEVYHGNPIGDGRALVTWDYGYDFEELLSRWSGTSVQVFPTLDRSKGIDALYNEVFVIKKHAIE